MTDTVNNAAREAAHELDRLALLADSNGTCALTDEQLKPVIDALSRHFPSTEATQAAAQRIRSVDKADRWAKHDENMQWLDEQVAAAWPSEAEAEAILREHGTSGREVVNGFINRLLRERQQFKDEAATARADAIRECAELARTMAAGETYETGRQKALNITAALESLTKGEGDDGRK